MLWLCISLPELSIEALQAQMSNVPTVVTDYDGNTRRIISCNSAATREHIHSQMNYAAALAISPQLVALPRKPKAEQQALERLAGWAYQFSSSVVISDVGADHYQTSHTCLWLEIGASLKLFGGLPNLIGQIEQQLRELHYTYALGIAPTLEGAALLARANIRLAITNLHALLMRIRHLPLSLLPAPPEIIKHLDTSGVRTLGLLLELPRDSLARRFGPEFSRYLDRLTGIAPDPRPHYRLPPIYRANFEFDYELKSAEALLFPLNRMLREFAGFLRAHDTGVQQFQLTFVHRDIAATALCVRLSLPERTAERFLSLAREQLERTRLPAPTLELQIAADHFTSPPISQSDLFNARLQQHEALAHTLDRITARLGEEHVFGLKTVADHRPEGSWDKSAMHECSEPLDFPDRPLWLLPMPKPLQLSTIPAIVSGPERIEGGWWDTRDVQRDYYVVRTNQGANLWIFRDLLNDDWYLHGFWS